MATTQIRGNTQIKSGTIYNAQIASDAAIAVSKLEALTTSGLVFTDGSGVLTATQIMGGDVTWSGSGFDINAGAIVNADIDASAAIDTSKLADGSLFLKSDGSVAMSMGNLNLGSNKIINLADAENSGDAVNKSQLDAAISALTNDIDYKNPVAAIAATNITLSGAQTIDGVSVTSGMRVGVVGQDNAYENGIYVASNSGWSRSADANTESEVTAGMFFLSTGGTNYIGTGWVLSNTPGSLGMDDLNFIQTQAPNNTLGGAGLTKTGNTLDVVSGNGGIVVNINDITLTVDATADSLDVTSSGIKLKDGTSADIYVADGSGVFQRVGVSGDITLSNAGVAAIASGVIVNADINASAAIALSKLAAVTAGYVVLGNASNVATATEVTGDVTINSSGVTAIGTGVIVNADISSSAAIALSKLAAGTSAQVIVCDGSGVPTYVTQTGDVTINASGVTAIASGVIVNADINASAAIALSKLATGTAGYLVVCNSSGVPTYVEMTGDATISDTGVVTVTGGLTTSSFTFNETPTGSVDGMNTDFVLAAAPVSGKLSVTKNGLKLKPGAGNDYTVTGDTITMASAPESGDLILVDYIVA